MPSNLDVTKQVAKLDPNAPVALIEGEPMIHMLEMGCGVGNALFPILRANPNITAEACDVSPSALLSLRTHDEYDSRRIKNVFICDARQESSLADVGDSTFDAVTMVFFLSALTDGEIRNVLAECCRVLKPLGCIFVRDYSLDDTKNLENSPHAPGEMLDDNLYLRGDGTSARFFSNAKLAKQFFDAGFKGAFEVKAFEQINRKKNLNVRRVFLDGRFTPVDPKNKEQMQKPPDGKCAQTKCR
jgi:methyltransferase-like protein 6